MTPFLDDSVALLREMVAIPSESFSEDAVCAHIASKLGSWAIEYEVIGKNIVARNKFYDGSKKTIALDAHIDTVPAAGSYTRDPYDPGDDPDIVWGLGSNDDGGSVVSLIAAFRHFYDSRDLPVNLVLSLSCEEERSGPGGARMLYASDGPLKPDWAIIGEPTGLRAATSERGLLVLDGEATGVSGHAARNEGVNALYIALDDISALRSHVFAKVSEMMGPVKLNVTCIEAGSAHNVIPDKCRFVVDIRPTDLYTNEEILEELQALCKSRLTPRNLLNRSSATGAGSPLLDVCAKLGIETFSSPTTSNWMRMRTDAIKIGPGESSRSHKADEFIYVSEIAGAIEKYIEIIETLYGNSLE